MLMRKGVEGPLYVVIPLFFLDICVSLAITIPLIGTLVRYRAHFSPKSIHLDFEDGVQEVPTQSGSTITGLLSTFRRVYRLEGWAGLYKGTMPAILIVLLFTPLTILPVLLYGPDTEHWPNKGNLSSLGVLGVTAVGVASLLISLPFTIISYRAIVTPYKLPYFDLKQSLRTLLTPTEQARPWILYLTPGLLVAQLLKIIVVVPAFQVLQSYVLPELPRSREGVDARYILHFSAYIALIALSASFLVPLEIVTTRLAIQRNHALELQEDIDPLADLNQAAETTTLATYTTEEDVIGLRDENDPYTSFLDCLKRIVSEEGRATLFRAWWITFIPLLLAGIVEVGKRPDIHM